MIKRLIAGVSAGVGYVLGARAGRERYDSLARMGNQIADSRLARSANTMVHEQAGRVEQAINNKVGRNRASTDVPSAVEPIDWSAAPGSAGGDGRAGVAANLRES